MLNTACKERKNWFELKMTKKNPFINQPGGKGVSRHRI